MMTQGWQKWRRLGVPFICISMLVCLFVLRERYDQAHQQKSIFSDIDQKMSDLSTSCLDLLDRTWSDQETLLAALEDFATEASDHLDIYYTHQDSKPYYSSSAIYHDHIDSQRSEYTRAQDRSLLQRTIRSHGHQLSLYLKTDDLLPDKAFSLKQGEWSTDTVQFAALGLKHRLILILCFCLFLLSLYYTLEMWFRKIISSSRTGPLLLVLVTLLALRVSLDYLWSCVLSVPWDTAMFQGAMSHLLNLALCMSIVSLIPAIFLRLKSWRRGLLACNYLLSFLIAMFYALLVQSALDYRNPILESGGLFSMGAVDTLYYASLLLVGLIAFSQSFRAIHYSVKWSKSFREKLQAYAIALGAAVVSYICLPISIGLLPLLLYGSALILLVDLFSERIHMSFAWIISWVIFLSIYTVMMIFHPHHEMENALFRSDAVTSYEEWSESKQDKSSLRKPHLVSIAIFDGSQLIYDPDNLAHQSIAQSRQLDELDDHQVWYSPKGGSVRLVSLFSYHFGILSIVLLILSLVQNFFPRGSMIMPIRMKTKASLADRIQSAIIASILFSFAIIALLTLLFFRNHFRESDSKNTHQEILRMQQGVSMDRALSRDVVGARKIGMYDLMGRLKRPLGEDLPLVMSSHDLQGTLSKQGYHLNAQAQEQTVSWLAESLDGAPLIYWALLSSQESESRAILDRFVMTLLNVYLFLFLIAAAVAIFLSDSITRPLQALRQRLRDFRLGRKNERLSWQQNDEIGELISNYNQLIVTVENSANMLAMNERDMAWREMARQVAHEIKNPLTPMKLRVQHLQNALKSRPDDAIELVERVSDTLIEQINNLSRIASEFSSFGKMPKANNEKVVLNDVVSSVHDLFRKREDISINMYTPLDEIYVFADRYHLNRILTNLIKNAIQAIPPQRKGRVDIRISKDHNNAVIAIKDNGTGIPADKRDKVFYPNFTTKNSGTGLGLAICSNLVDLFQGKIYFNTMEGEGTEFFVEIPLMRVRDNYREVERVEL